MRKRHSLQFKAKVAMGRGADGLATGHQARRAPEDDRGLEAPGHGGHPGKDFERLPAKVGQLVVERDFVTFRVDPVHEALARFDRPKFFNTDQGNQFTSADFTDVVRGSLGAHFHGRARMLNKQRVRRTAYGFGATEV